MLWFDRFPVSPTRVRPGTEIAEGVRLVFDPASAMSCEITRRMRTDGHGRAALTLHVSGSNRAPDDWFAVEADVGGPRSGMTLTMRNFPVYRLFPRLHYDRGGRTAHLDLPDLPAGGDFTGQVIDPALWAGDAGATAPDAVSHRLTLLIPSSPWFVFEIASMRRTGGDDA